MNGCFEAKDFDSNCFASELAAKVMIELLGTYTSENASVAREDAMKCIVTALADPNTFLLDPLLSLTPVRFLEGELIHDLLTVFVSDTLAGYMKFYKSHKEFVTSQGLNHEQNMKKMRLLSFMQLAESNPEMSFAQLQKELQIKEEEVEPFIIEGMRALEPSTAFRLPVSLNVFFLLSPKNKVGACPHGPEEP